MYFKAVNRDLTGYGGYQFSVGKTHRIVGNVKLCANGFHFCRQLHLCLDYYDINSRFFKVRVSEIVEDSSGKLATNKIQLHSEIYKREVNKILDGKLEFPERTEYRKLGVIHRLDGPAIIYRDGTEYWFFNGKIHRDEDKPAVITPHGLHEWYHHGKRHRDNDLPAVTDSNGNQEWYYMGLRHRDLGKPAVENSKFKSWWRNGKPYRGGNKPIIEFTDGSVKYS